MNKWFNCFDKFRKKYVEIGLIIICIFAICFFIDGINTIENQVIGYDEGYNATVAANVARHGEYRVSYPDNIVFYNMITTGTPVILPTALIYKIFGINYITSSIVPLIYMTISIIMMWKMLDCSIHSNAIDSIISALLVVFIITSDKIIAYISTHLIGEGACVLFLVVACFCFKEGCIGNKNILFVITGYLVMASFLTKSSMIFFVISLIGLIFIERLLKHINTKNLICFWIGIVSGFITIDSYKFVQLGSFEKWINWWKAEWMNMLSQSGQNVDKPSISEKFAYLAEIFGINKYAAAFVVVLPSLIYIFILIGMIQKKINNVNIASYSLYIWGVAASSLEIYFVLFGGSGLLYPRRHEVNVIFVKLVVCLLFGKALSAVISTIKKRDEQALYNIVLVTLLIFCILPTLPVMDNLRGYISRKHEKDYDRVLMENFLNEVDTINPAARILCLGWWQEPDISIFLDRDMEDISAVDLSMAENDNMYFVIGRRFDNCSTEEVENIFNIELEQINSIQVDYNRCNGYNSDELFTIYKVNACD